MTQVHSLKAANQVHRLRNCERKKKIITIFIYLCFVHQCMETLPSGVCWTHTTTLCVSSCGVRNSRLPSHLLEGHCVTGPGLLWKQSKKKVSDFWLISYFIEQRHVWVKFLHMYVSCPEYCIFSTHLLSWPDPPVCLACWLLFSARDLGNFCYWVVYPLLPRIITQQTFCYCFFVLFFLVMQTHKLLSKLLGNFKKNTNKIGELRIHKCTIMIINLIITLLHK